MVKLLFFFFFVVVDDAVEFPLFAVDGLFPISSDGAGFVEWNGCVALFFLVMARNCDRLCFPPPTAIFLRDTEPEREHGFSSFFQGQLWSRSECRSFTFFAYLLFSFPRLFSTECCAPFEGSIKRDRTLSPFLPFDVNRVPPPSPPLYRAFNFLSAVVCFFLFFGGGGGGGGGGGYVTFPHLYSCLFSWAAEKTHPPLPFFEIRPTECV